MSTDPTAVLLDPVVTQIDHVLCRARDADGLFRVFVETLQLPVAWPMAEYGGFVSAGVRLGNVNLEILRATPDALQDVHTGGAAHFTGIAFEPAGTVEASLARLRARNIPHGAPRTGRAWVTIGLPDFLPGSRVFLCRYTSAADQPPPMRVRHLRGRDGGPLGVERVREVVVGVSNVEGAERHWFRLLTPSPSPRPGTWLLGTGPAVRLEAAPAVAIVRLVLQVRDLDRAAAFLRERLLLGEATGPQVTIADGRVGSLPVSLTAPAEERRGAMHAAKGDV
jgi:hypothetical protein